MSDHVTLREIVTNLLYPPRCLLCGTLCGWEELLCESCQKQQPQAGEFFWEPEVFGCRGILWCARYEGAFRAGMEQLKFEGVRESLPLFGGMLTEAVRQSGLLPQLTAVTYVPMPPERERHRGYNQSKLLAEQLAKELGLPLREGVLARDGRATAHAAAGRAARVTLGFYLVVSEEPGQWIRPDEYKTGDGFPLGWYVGMMAVTGGALAVLGTGGRRRRGDEDEKGGQTGR